MDAMWLCAVEDQQVAGFVFTLTISNPVTSGLK
jgi:hypothetical protein